MRKLVLMLIGVAMLNCTACGVSMYETTEETTTENITEEVVITEETTEEVTTTEVYISQEYLQELEYNSRKNQY